MEPESRLYTSPVVVLDFQSLYPSLIIAYNLCYSTAIGKPSHANARGAPLRMGVASYAPPDGVFAPGCAGDPRGLVIAPNGVGYVPPGVRPGVLPRMLQEILATRVMIKDVMKKTPVTDKVGGV
jgi:DNA polymerase zeta